MSTNTGPKANEPMDERKQSSSSQGWLPNLSLSHWLAIVALPIGMIGALYLFWNEEKTRVNVYVPARELPAYYQIQPNDLIPKPYASRSIPSDILNTFQEIVGHYTLTQLPEDKPLTANQLGVKLNPTCLTNTIAVSLPATPAMTFGGNLKAGDTISITFGSPPATKESVLPPPAQFSDLLVLDVKAVLQANTASTSVIVIALPRGHQQEFATQLTRATVLVSRSLSGRKNSCIM